MNSLILAIFGLISLTIVSVQGETVKCFVCNSYVDKACLDPFPHTSPALRSKYLEECPINEGKEPFCRKVSTSIARNGEVRIQRECAYMSRGEDDICYQNRSDEFIQDICECNTHECNGAKGVMISTVAMIMPVIIAMFL